MSSTAGLPIVDKKWQIVTFIKQSWGGEKLSFELSCSHLDSSELCIFLPTVMLGGSRRDSLAGKIIFTALTACLHVCGSGPFVCTWPPSVLFLLNKCPTHLCLLMSICKTGCVRVTAYCFRANMRYGPLGGLYAACFAGRPCLSRCGQPHKASQRHVGCVYI